MDAEMWFYVVGAFLVVSIPSALYCRIRYGSIWGKGKWTDGLTIGFITYVVVKITLKYYIFPTHPPLPPVVEQSAETQTEFETKFGTARKVPGGGAPLDYLLNDDGTAKTIEELWGPLIPPPDPDAVLNPNNVDVDDLSSINDPRDRDLDSPDYTPIPLEPNVDPE